MRLSDSIFEFSLWTHFDKNLDINYANFFIFHETYFESFDVEKIQNSLAPNMKRKQSHLRTDSTHDTDPENTKKSLKFIKSV